MLLIFSLQDVMAAINHSLDNRTENRSNEKSEVIAFLDSTLGVSIPKDFSLISGQSRLRILNDIIKSFQSHIPFQNIVLMSKVASERHLPTLDELSEDVISKRGGMCYTNNVFFKRALEALGFQAYHVACSVSNTIVSNSHIITCVQDVVQEGDLYVAEVGCGYATFRAICMDFVAESPTYKDSTCTYKLVKVNTIEPHVGYSTYERWQRQDGIRQVPLVDERGEDWYRFYSFTLEPRSLEFFRSYVGVVYENPTATRFHRVIAFSCFPKGQAVTLTSIIDNDGDGKEIRKLVLKEEMAGGVITKEQFDLEPEVPLGLNRIKELLPELKNHIADALHNLNDASLT